MDLAYAAEQYAQAQAVAAVAAQYYANAANAMNAAMAGQQGAPGMPGFGMMPQLNPAVLGGPHVLGPQFMVRPTNPFMDHMGQIQHQQPPPPGLLEPEPESPELHREKYHQSSGDESENEDRRSPYYNRRVRDRRDSDTDRDRDRRERKNNEGRSRDRSRSPERRIHRDRSPKRDSRESERERRDRTPDSDDDGKNVPPNSTIMVRGLAQHIGETDIRQDIKSLGLTPKDIRLIGKKDTGASRGFAFVEFYSVQDAEKWMDAKQGVLILKDRFRAVMQYSLPRDGRLGELPQILHDWICGKCGVQNFRRRDLCFRCNGPKTDIEYEGNEDVSPTPTSTVLLRGLDTLSTEDSVLTYLMQVTNLPIKNIRIGRDSLTNTSRGICYVEMNSLTDAVLLHNQLLDEPPTIDNRLISVSYYRVTSLTSASNQSGQSAANALAAAQWNRQTTTKKSDEEIEQLAEYSANVYAKTAKEKAYYLDYYRNYYRNGGETQNAGQGQPKAKPEASGMVTVNGVEYTRYPTPDVSSYTYDGTSGYYYDPSTMLYYDATTTYYYNSKTASYLYWSQEHHTYIPCNVDESQSKSGVESEKKKDDKKDKVKSAKKIAKDMERWAKSQNQRKEAMKSLQAPSTSTTVDSTKPGNGSGGGLEDVAFSMLQKQAGVAAGGGGYVNVNVNVPKPEVVPTRPPAAQGSSGLAGLAGLANYASDSDNDDQGSNEGGPASGVTDETKLTDWVKLACLLCMRQFPAKDKLQKHNQVSDLHKQNLESWRKKQTSTADSRANQNQYRDRAKERRQKYGEVDEPKPNFLKEKYLKAIEEVETLPQPEKNIGSDNIGNKMLQKMGWKEGLGLGKSNQGRTAIVEADHRGSQAGLGSAPGVKRLPNESYRDAGKRVLYQRFHDN